MRHDLFLLQAFQPDFMRPYKNVFLTFVEKETHVYVAVPHSE